MSNCTQYLGLDVHAQTITAGIAERRQGRPDSARGTLQGVSWTVLTRVDFP
jgi:hypothetical protein